MSKRMRWLTMLALWLLAAVAHAGTHHYYYTDPQGTVLAKADASGTILATYDYMPYGQAVASMSPAPNGPGYTGHVNDPDTGLVYMQARYYDPGRGGFLSVDPVGVSSGNTFNFNRYGYADNNPIVNIDPFGLTTWPVNGKITAKFGEVNSIRGNVPHDGIDIKNGYGSIVVASDSGTVISISNGIAGTHQIIIKNNDGSVSGYAHVAGTVAIGDVIQEGDSIGTTDTSGRSTGPHLHYTYRPSAGSPRVDPLTHLPSRDTPPPPLPPVDPNIPGAPEGPSNNQKHPNDNWIFG